MMLALEGIVVLDMTRVLPGSYCTMILGDMGAEVIKIEEPRSGARSTGSGISPAQGEGQREAAYNPLNRNKKSIGLNLKSTEGRGVFYKLVEKADVLLEANRPGVAQRLGADYDTVKERNPRLVYCSISGYGQDGPYHDLPGHDVNYISMAGILDITGQPGRPPVIPGIQIGDFAGGAMHACIGILLALMARGRTGSGQYVDISMLDGVLSWMAQYTAQYFLAGVVPSRGVRSAPYRNAYRTKDGKFVSVNSLEPIFWANLCAKLGRPEFIAEQNAGQKRQKEITSCFRRIFRTKTRDEWFDLLKADTCAAPVYSLDEALGDPQVLHRQMVVEVEHPVLGIVKQIGISIKLSETPGQIRATSPFLGEHTNEVLHALGYSKQDIERLQSAGAIT